MTIDEVVSHAKSDFVSWSTDISFAAILGVPYIGTFISLPVIAPIVKYAIAFVMKAIADRIDFAGYFIFKTVQNNIDASNYEDKMRASRDAAESGDQDAIDKARKDQLDAFARLWSL